MKAKILFIINPKSGIGKKDSLPELIDKCIDKNLFDYQIVYTEYAGHATKLTQQAVKTSLPLLLPLEAMVL